jgi:UDP-hydrolysing UDP-N-acetyl-D-glucosamine 2-epimerase
VSRRKVCIVIGSRANYSSIKSAMRAVRDHPDLELQLVLGASALLDRYGAVANLVRADGFEPQAEVHMLIEGETPATMAKSTGLGLLELPTIFGRLAPDFVLTVGDRFETMATALAAAYMNIPLAHTMGGEVSGTIDESIRHAVTKFAHVHFAASEDAGERIIRLGERPEDVHVVGCPRIDLVAEILANDASLPAPTDIFREGVGAIFDLTKPFLLVSQHPVTTEYGSGKAQISETLKAVSEVGLPAIVLWPNPDAGSEDIAAGIRWWREKGFADNMHFFKNLPIETYVKLMRHTACLVGNSSSGIREGAYVGTPVVNIGTRQQRRLAGSNVIHVPHGAAAIRKAIERQVEHGRYTMEPIYGVGKAGEKIADILSYKTVNAQKLITY